MMNIETLTVGQMQENCYLVSDKFTSETLIVDPGDDADYIQRRISDLNLKPIQIIATHGHFDHIMAVLELQLAFNIPFKINCKDEFLVKNMIDSSRHFLGIDSGPIPQINGCLKDNMNIKIGKTSIKIIFTPGHTPGSICLYAKENNSLLTGDTIFAEGGVGRTDFKYSSHEELLSSLKKNIQVTRQNPNLSRSRTKLHA